MTEQVSIAKSAKIVGRHLCTGPYWWPKTLRNERGLEFSNFLQSFLFSDLSRDFIRKRIDLSFNGKHSWWSHSTVGSESWAGRDKGARFLKRFLPFSIIYYSSSIQDVRVPVQLQRAMAAEAEAAREARAKVVAAEGEQKASLHLKEAALVLEESTSALQLRYLQVWDVTKVFMRYGVKKFPLSFLFVFMLC